MRLLITLSCFGVLTLSVTRTNAEVPPSPPADVPTATPTTLPKCTPRQLGVQARISAPDPARLASQLDAESEVSAKFVQRQQAALSHARQWPVGVLLIGDSILGWPKSVAAKRFVKQIT